MIVTSQYCVTHVILIQYYEMDPIIAVNSNGNHIINEIWKKFLSFRECPKACTKNPVLK